MAPIRVGFIGLASTQSWAVWSHLPYLKSSPKYEIVALCNSDVEKAHLAIQKHGLPPTTKAYGSPEDLAADPDVDLVVCSVRVDKHYKLLVPSLKAGKNVFCEWPLASNAAQAEEMLALAKETKAKTLIGLQAHQSPAMKKIKEIIESGRIGKVQSTTFHGTPRFFGPTGIESAAHSQERSIGANLLSIYSMHVLESIQYVLGPIASYTPLLSIQNPEVQLLNSAGEPTRKITRTSHDQALIQGTLASGAVLSYHLRGGPVFKKTDGHIWRIYGSKGEIQTTSADSYIHISDTDIKIEVSNHATGETETVAVDSDEFSDHGLYSRNVGRLYEKFADGKGEEDGVLDWEAAVKRHRFISEVYEKAGVVE